MKVTGQVFTGQGKAREFLQLKPYRDFLADKIGEPYPGTLNLRVDVVSSKRLKEQAKFYRLEGFNYYGEDYGGLNLYIVKTRGLVVGLIEPDRTRYGDDVVELVSEHRLRDRLDLSDGDSIEIETLEA